MSSTLRRDLEVRLTLSARVSLASNAIAWLAIGLAWSGLLPAPPLSFVAHKALHLVGVVVFGGNLVVGPLWLGLAWWADDTRLLAFGARSLAQADVFLTTPGVQLAIWNGLFAAQTYGGVSAQPWLVETAVLMLVVSLLSCTLVLYWQERLVALAEAGDRPGATRAMLWWSLWGTALAVPFGWVFLLMLTKRAIWLS